MGGQVSRFTHTAWTQILAVRTQDSEHKRAIRDALLGRYWRPVYAYLRRKGRGNEEAKDLTQEFFTEVVLERELLEKADPAKGRFRTFLLTALDNFVHNERRAAEAKKRMPEGGLARLDAMIAPEDLCPGGEATPEEAFVYGWALQLLNEVIAAVEEGCREDGKGTHWEVFRRTWLDPLLLGTDPAPLADLCEELGIEGIRRASNMNVTVKRRFKTALCVRIRDLVNSDDEVEQEIRELIRILGRRSAG